MSEYAVLIAHHMRSARIVNELRCEFASRYADVEQVSTGHDSCWGVNYANHAQPMIETWFTATL